MSQPNDQHLPVPARPAANLPLSLPGDDVVCLYVRNPLEPVASAVPARFVCDGGPARDYASRVAGAGDFALGLDGQLIDPDLILRPGDVLVICPVGGGGNFFRLFAAIVVTVLAFYTQQHWAYGGVWGAYAAGAVVSVGGMYAVNSMFPVSPAAMGRFDDAALDRSTNYGWGMPSNAWQEGGVLPELIGERRFAPPRIGSYRFLPAESQERQRLRLLYAMCGNTIDALTASDVFLDNGVITGFPGASFDYTRGLATESRILPWFTATQTEVQHGIELPDAAAEAYSHFLNVAGLAEGSYIPAPYHTIAANITQLDFQLVLQIPDQTALGDNTEIGIDTRNYVIAEYRQAGSDGPWTAVNFSFSAAISNSGYCWLEDYQVYGSYGYFRLQGLASANYEVRFGVHLEQDYYASLVAQMRIGWLKGYSSVSEMATVTTTGTDITRIGVGLLCPGGVYYLNSAGGFENHTVAVSVAVRPYGATAWTAVRLVNITAATSEPIRRFVEFVGLAADQWEVSVFISGTLPGSNRYRHDVTFEFLQEGIDQAFSYPGVALLALDVPALEQFAGQWPVVEVKAKAADYASGTRASTNPAWAAYYRLLETYGVPAADIETAHFEAWATFCDTQNLTVSLYLDAPLTMDAVLQQIATAGRATIVRYGASWDVVIETESEPVMTFGSDNIKEDTFEITYASDDNLANTVCAWFFDKDGDYRRTPVKVKHPSAANEAEKLHEVTLYGVDNLAQATAHAILLLNQTYLMRRKISWVSSVDAIGCRLGDVVYLQNNFPVWGLTPGRVVSATSNTVTCDLSQDFSDAAWSGRILRILVRHQTPDTGEAVDDIERLALVNPHGTVGHAAVTTYTLSGTTFARIPSAGALVLIGWVTGAEESTDDELLSVKQVRIASIEHADGRDYRISAIEYYDDGMQTDYIVSTLPAAESGLEVADVSAAGAWLVAGQVQTDYILLQWTGNAADYYVFYRQEISTGNYGDWRFYRRLSGHAVRVQGLAAGHTYQFSVSVRNAPDTDHTATIDFDVADHGALLSAVTNLRCASTGNQTWLGRDLDLTWDDFTLFTLDYYRVQIYNAAETEVLRTVRVERAARFVYTYEMNAQDHLGAAAAVKARVTVVDKNGNESATAIISFANPAPASVTGLLTTAGSASAFVGRDVDVVWSAPADTDIETYEITVTHGGAVLRTAFAAARAFRYAYTMNREDGAGTASNSVVFRVRSVDAFGQYSGYTTGTFANPAPAMPGGLSASQWMNGIRFTWNASTERDFDYYLYRTQVEAEGWSGWVQTRSQTVDLFLTEAQADAYDNGATVCITLHAVDTFGTQSDAVQTYAVTGAVWVPPTDISDIGQLSGAFTDLPVLVGDAWTNNSPTAGSAAWNAHSLWYAGTQYAIASGSTANRYIYWDNAAGTYSTSATAPTLGDGDFIIAENLSGTVQMGWDADANRVIGSAYIGQAAILDLNVGNVAANKILANTVMTPGVTLGDYIVVSGDVSNTDTLPDNALIMGNNSIGFKSSGQMTVDIWLAEVVGINFQYGNGDWHSNPVIALSPPIDAAGARKLNGYVTIELKCSDWSKCHLFYMDLFSDTIAPYALWRLVVDDSYLSGMSDTYQTFTIPLADFDLYSGAIDPDFANLTYFQLYAFFSEQETLYFRNAKIVYDKYPVLINTEDNKGKYYIGDNANVYLDFDGVRLNLSPTTINVRSGADINMIGSDTNPGKINFVGTSYAVLMGGDADGNRFEITPSVDNAVDLKIGSGTLWSDVADFKSMTLTGKDDIKLLSKISSGSTPYFAGLSVDYNSGYPIVLQTLFCPAGGGNEVKHNFYYDGAVFYNGPAGTGVHKVVDLARSSAAYDDAYADDWNNVADFYFLDSIRDKDGRTIEIDDVAVLKAIRPSTAIDERTGMTVINDATLPTWLVTRHKTDGEERAPEDHEADAKWHWVQPGDRVRIWRAGDVAVGPEGKPYISNKTFQSLLMGALRRLDARLAVLEK